MFRKLVSRNADLGRLVDRGYAVAFDSNCLIVRDIPYLEVSGALRFGAIVAKLAFVDRDHVQQVDHQVYFAGGHPHALDGSPIRNLGGGAATIPLTERFSDVKVERSFSNKPRQAGKFDDFFHKIESYVSVISGPAIERHRASPYTFRCDEEVTEDEVFKFQDTLTSRAEIGDLAACFKDEVIAIIGLGGTGGFILDAMVKTPVSEIRGFDGDDFHVHTAFRSPGALREEELGRPKAEVYQARYGNFRHGLYLEVKYIDETSREELDGVTFAFVCVDKGSSRAAIFDLLIAMGIPFIDVGMGLSRKHGTLNGMLRTTYFAANDADDLRKRGIAELSDASENLYRANIQIGELNALNACLAVLRYKQLRGFYLEDQAYKHLLFEIGDMSIIGETSFDAV